MTDEAKPARKRRRVTRPHQRNYRFTTETVELLTKLSFTTGVSQTKIIENALVRYADECRRVEKFQGNA